MVYDFDLFTLGAGSAGVRASRQSAALGARVGIAESGAFGGTCVNLGCVPKKLMAHAAHLREDLALAAGLGWSIPEARFDWATLAANRNREVARLASIYERLLDSSGVEILHGRARITGPHEVEVDGRRFSAANILVATGSTPRLPHTPGSQYGLVSDDVFRLAQEPRRIAVVGGGYIAVELASILCGLGSEASIIYRGPHLLRGFDDDAREFLARELAKKGVNILFNTLVDAIDKSHAGLRCLLSTKDDLEVDAVLYAIGRVPNSVGLGLRRAGVQLGEGGGIVVDEHFRSSVPSIYAVGDVIDRVMLTPVAIREAMVVADTLFGGPRRTLSYDNIPTAVFSSPQLATVGLTEAQARERCARIDVYTSEFRPLKYSLGGLDERMLIKVIVDGESNRVVGVHIVGVDAAEIIQALAVAVAAGITKDQLDATVALHPTVAEELVTLRDKRPVDENVE